MSRSQSRDAATLIRFYFAVVKEVEHQVKHKAVRAIQSNVGEAVRESKQVQMEGEEIHKHQFGKEIQRYAGPHTAPNVSPCSEFIVDNKGCSTHLIME